MKKIISWSGILSLLLSQTGCIGDSSSSKEEPIVPQEETVVSVYATPAIKQQLAERLLGEKDPIPADYFESINYFFLLQSLMKQNLSALGEQEEQQVFWYTLMVRRLKALSYAFEQDINWQLIGRKIDDLGEPVSTFAAQHPRKTQEIFADVLAYEEAHPYNPQPGMKPASETLPPAPKEEQPKQSITEQKITLTNEQTGEKMEVSIQELTALNRQEFAEKFHVPPEEVDQISDEEFEQQKQKMLEMFSAVDEFQETFEQFGEKLEKDLEQSLTEAFGPSVQQQLKEQMQKGIHLLDNGLPDTFPAAREQSVQDFKNQIKQFQQVQGMTDYAVYMQAPNLFPAEILSAKFTVGTEKDNTSYTLPKSSLVNGPVTASSGFSVKKDMLPQHADITWYSIAENKNYALSQELPFEAIKENLVGDNRLFDSVLITLAPYGQVIVYAYNAASEKKRWLVSLQAPETEIAFADFSQTNLFYNKEGTTDWSTYQQNALASLPQAATYLLHHGLPPKDFDFWAADTSAEESSALPEMDKLNELNSNGNTPLMEAIQLGKDTLVTQLLLAGADVNIHSPTTGQSALELACFFPPEDKASVYIKQLLAAKADINAANTLTGMTPLASAIMDGRVEIVKLLLEAGADVNAPILFDGQDMGWNALRVAKEYNQPELAQLLREHGAKE